MFFSLHSPNPPNPKRKWAQKIFVKFVNSLSHNEHVDGDFGVPEEIADYFENREDYSVVAGNGGIYHLSFSCRSFG